MLAVSVSDCKTVIVWNISLNTSYCSVFKLKFLHLVNWLVH
jgi:hypothetical protein